jgi:hypothetical protein
MPAAPGGSAWARPGLEMAEHAESLTMWDYPLAQGFEGSFLLTVLDVFLELLRASIVAVEAGTIGQGGVLAELCTTESPTLAYFMGILQQVGLFTCS